MNAQTTPQAPFVRSIDVAEFEHHKFVQEASTLGLPPGRWPLSIATSMGNGQPFVAARVGEGGVRIYRQALGCIELHVLND